MAMFRLRLMAQVLPFLLVAPGIGHAQPSPAEAAAALNPGALSQAQLDQLLAPIALYPDQLLMDVLMAATFPQQVVDAGQWLQNPANAALKGDALVGALAPLPWDPSVKSLVAFPGVIGMMNVHLDWTQALGTAFAGQQIATMAEIQALRNRAIAARQLVSNAQITVVHEGPIVVINPTRPGLLYVPVYNPAVVYGPWPYAAYPPVYIPPPPGFVAAGYAPGPGIAFSVGFGIIAPLWGWGHPDWGRHTIVVDPATYGRITPRRDYGGNHVAIEGTTWRRTAPVVPVAAGRVPRSEGPVGPRPPGTVDPGAIRLPERRGALPPGVSLRPGEPGPREVRPGEPGPREIRPGEPGPREVRPGEPGPREIRPGEPGPREVRPGEPGPREVRPGEPGPREVRPIPPRPEEHPRAVRPTTPTPPRSEVRPEERPPATPPHPRPAAPPRSPPSGAPAPSSEVRP